MNDWRENLHPRGGDPDHPGRFSKGHGGRHYNPPPGLEHLAMHHPDQHHPAEQPHHHRALCVSEMHHPDQHHPDQHYHHWGRCVRELGDAGQEIV